MQNHLYRRDYTSPDYRRTDNQLRLVIGSAVSTQTDKWTDGQMERDGYMKYKTANIEGVASKQTLLPSLIMLGKTLFLHVGN